MRKSNIRNFTRWNRWLAALLACACLCGCGTALPPVTTPPVSTIAPDAQPVAGGSFSIVMALNPVSLSPLEADSREMYDVYSLLYDSLIRYDDQLRAIPGLAESWTVNLPGSETATQETPEGETPEGETQDGCTWTFTIRGDVQFHNGKTLTAQDVVHTLDVIAAYRKDAQRTSMYEGIFDYIQSYSATDARTLVIRTKKQDGRLLHQLTFPIIPEGYGALDAETQEIIPGTGAYRVTAYEAGQEMQLTANDNWWRTTPYITNITVKGVADADTALSSLEVRLVDVVHATSRTASRYEKEGTVDALELMTQEFECIIPNMQSSAVADVRMRRAIIAALDRKTIITEAYLGHAVAVDGCLPSDAYYYSATSAQHSYSVATAKELLAEMGYADTDGDGYLEKDGQKLTLRVIVNENISSSARADAATIAVKMLKNVGIDCTLSVLSFNDYTKALQNGNFDLAFAGFTLGTDGDLSFLLHSTQATHNYGRYRAEELDALLEQYIAAMEETQIVSLAAQIQKYCGEHLPLISLYYRTNTLLYSSAIYGVRSARDMDVYKAIERWYMLVEGDSNKADTPE